MTDFDPPDVPELIAPLLDEPDDTLSLPVVPLTSSADDDELTLGPPTQPQVPRRRRRGRLVVAVAALLAITAAVGIPLAIGQAQTVSAAVAGVFAQSTVRFAVSASAHSPVPGDIGDSTGGLGSYSIVVTLTNPTGGPVSEQGVSDAMEISVVHSGTDLGDFLLANGAFYLRLDTTAIDQLETASVPGTGGTLTATLKRAARRPVLAWLNTVVDGNWIGLKESAVEQYAKRVDPHAGTSDVDEARLRSAFTLSFAQAWDAWQSTHVLSASRGVTEYSVSLPVRDFLGSFLADLETQVDQSVPSARRLVPTLRKAVDDIPARLTIPVQLWVENGNLIKVAVSYKGTTVSVGISHPSVGVAAPASATMITIADIRAFGHWFVSDEIEGSGDATVAAQSNLETGLTGALTSYTNDNQSFADVLNRASPNSIYSLDTGLRFVAGAPSTSAGRISVSVGASGASLTMTAYARGTRDCLGVLDLTVNQSAPVLGIASKVGVYLFENRHVAAAACNASTITKAETMP